jgi:hypothetical protein
MYFNTNQLVFCLFILSAFNWTCSRSSVPKQQSAMTEGVVKSRNFPKDWKGTWHGELEIFSARANQKVPMWVEIAPMDTSTQGRWTFGLVYQSKDKDYRPYEIVPIDTSKGIWAVDEKNSIIMESYLRGPKFICWFVVNQSRVLCTYELTSADELVFEVISGQEIALSSTGNTIQGTDTIPEVNTFPIGVFQRAILKRE